VFVCVLDFSNDAFCGNVASLPLDDSSTFIRSTSGRGFISSLGAMTEEVKGCQGPILTPVRTAW
jgi:hypothetical protein